MERPLSSLLSALDVDNVFLHVADAVRWDALPEPVDARGITAKGVAPSIHSPTSFASLVSGRYPPSTGVYSFAHRVSVPTLFDTEGVDTRYESTMLGGAGADDALFSVFDIEPGAHHGSLDTVEPPFIALERGNGGHAPYGDSDLTAWKYFERHGDHSARELRTAYERRIEADTDRFLGRLRTLDARGLAEDTLVVYTADHGELLGEGGVLGHNEPTRPELVYVPVVFVHPDLPDESISAAVPHVDLFPTMYDVLGRDPPTSRLDGQSLRSGSPTQYGLSFYDSRFFDGRVPGVSGALRYEGAWDAGGGHVFPRSSLASRLAILSGKLVKSPKREYLRRHLGDAVRTYARGAHTYGTPAVDRPTAAEALETAGRNAADGDEVQLSADAREQLKDMGYL